MRYQNIIENYINGNLKDFAFQYSKIRKTVLFWSYVREYYGEKIQNEAQTFLIKKGF